MGSWLSKHKMDETERIQKRIQQIQIRIYDLNDKASGVTSESELRKIKKSKDKLFKEKNKLLSRLVKGNNEEEIEDDEDI